MPNDEKEQGHLDICHQMLTLAIGGNLFRAPIDKNPQRILDIGTGTGLYLTYGTYAKIKIFVCTRLCAHA